MNQSSSQLSPASPTVIANGKPCPRCGRNDVAQIKFTWWGGAIGPRMLHHVRCRGCGTAFNHRTGGSNAAQIGVYVAVIAVVMVIALRFVL